MPPPSSASIEARDCPVCNGSQSHPIFTQRFSSLSSGGLLSGYDIVACSDCGFAFARDLPPQTVFDHYYAEMSKYENSGAQGMVSTTYQDNYRLLADALVPHILLHESIADVGCATGGLLAEIKSRGFQNVVGFDPSSNCASIAKSLYGIEVHAMPINALNGREERFDVVMLTGVLEHLRDVGSSLKSVSALLKPGGRLFLVVPDACQYEQWCRAPYQFFSVEHVNYFSTQSLKNALAQVGFRCLSSSTPVCGLGPNTVEPTIAATFTLSDEPPALVRDEITEPALRRYVEISRAMELRINDKIAAAAASGVPLAVWGAGTHTLRLMETSDLSKANIVAFIDSNSRYQGKDLLGRPIVASEQFVNPEATILISSQTAEDEIWATIKTRLNWPNKVVRLYSE